MFDLHSHVLAGIDDGPETLEGSVALAHEAADRGVRTLLATPHVSPRYPNRAAEIAELVGELNTRLQSEGAPIEIRAGAEIAVARVPGLEADELRALSLGGGPWLLIEPPFAAAAPGLGGSLLELQGEGHRILLAHPERCPLFQRNAALLQSLVGAGILTSITAGSLVGDFGELPRRFAMELFERGLAHNVASDAHDLDRRPPGISEPLERAGLADLAEWLTEEVPAAILAGEEPPPRPADFSLGESSGRRRWWRGRRP